MSIPYVNSPDQLNNYLKSSEAVVVYFTAVWCGPCQAIAPVVEQLYSNFTNVEILKVDLDSNKILASQKQITAVPTFIFYHKNNEVNRVQGANIKSISDGIAKLSELAPNGKRRGASDSSNLAERELDPTIVKYVPKGFQTLNESVFFADFESLNTIPYRPEGDIKNAIRSKPDVSSGGTAIVSDADEQLLLHIPLTNIGKVYSILIKSKKPATDGEVEVDEVQKPTKVKVWNNRTSILGFEDTDGTTTQHEEELSEESWDENGWYEVKFKYVRFQKVSSIDLFFEGEDDEKHTLIDKIVLIGVDGESKNQGKLEKLED
ncbi:hypothetical protein BN7_4264 [Wickerhamomyces ciferrii]|uniref:Thioredoxin-like protein 1 n=1 Tax=Wickerhamomyces ciferrii (strain ATCC 14091 / BCRC 22168 / CBS 111 / JCM 3599 / NBRC 0793 / NRRL Y-1031 F-60-10) TaxID=1206466 RepID=K0KP05_WICCF|nr:uncharacterized protein BN7_4264 [Wickerhamomyces ciferrii]CCH44696.1 hypothetical protein BN7_4264 [Wickerhamomyces ciferrii]